jgi:hypothetical protein
MPQPKIKAVELKRRLQTLAEEKLVGMSPEEQMKFLRKKFGRPALRNKATSPVKK